MDSGFGQDELIRTAVHDWKKLLNSELMMGKGKEGKLPRELKLLCTRSPSRSLLHHKLAAIRLFPLFLS